MCYYYHSSLLSVHIWSLQKLTLFRPCTLNVYDDDDDDDDDIISDGLLTVTLVISHAMTDIPTAAVVRTFSKPSTIREL